MSNIEINIRDIAAGLEPDGHVEVQRVAPFGSKILVEGVILNTKKQIKPRSMLMKLPA